MEVQTEQKIRPKKVEELKNFPFKSFDELNKRISEGVANLGVDRSVALNWIQKGIYSSKNQNLHAVFLAFLPFIAVIGFIIYILFTGSWLLLLSLPLVLIVFFIFHPSSAMIFGFIRTGLVWLTFIGLFWGWVNNIGWLTAITLTLGLIWYGQRTIYRKAVDGLIGACLEHEDLLCLIWSGNALNVTMYNGDSYWSEWKTEAGKSTHYELGNIAT